MKRSYENLRNIKLFDPRVSLHVREKYDNDICTKSEISE